MPTSLNSTDLEIERQAALDALRLVDTLPEAAYDAIARLAAVMCGTPVALVSLIDRDRQWFKARFGLDVEQTPRDIAFCDWAIRTPESVLEVNDATQDPRFRDNPLVTGEPDIRFYAGRPLLDGAGHALGTLCVIDRVPRELDEAQRQALDALAQVVEALVAARRDALRAQRALADKEFAYSCLARYRSYLETRLAQDGLTGLLNRAEADRRLRLYEDGEAVDPFVLAVLDIDLFKQVNDSHGHAAGDSALKAVAHAINSHVPADDIVGRYGGEEFLIVLAESDRALAIERLERIRASVEALPLAFPLTVSIGVAFGTGGRDGVEDVFARADRALYRAKQGGRNRIEVDAG